MIQKNKKKKLSLINIFIIIILLLIFFAIIFSLVIANFKIKKRRAEILSQTNNIQKEIETIKKIKEELEYDISRVENDDYLEKIAREKLGLKLEGEEVVYIKKEKEEVIEKEIEEKEERGWKERIKSFFKMFL